MRFSYPIYQHLKSEKPKSNARNMQNAIWLFLNPKSLQTGHLNRLPSLREEKNLTIVWAEF